MIKHFMGADNESVYIFQFTKYCLKPIAKPDNIQSQLQLMWYEGSYFVFLNI